MKIGIITDIIDDNAAGLGTYARNLVENIVKIDMENKYVLVHNRESNDSVYKRRDEIIIPTKKDSLRRGWRKIFKMPKILEKSSLELVHEPVQLGPFFLKSRFKKVITIADLVPLRFSKTQPLVSQIAHKIGLPLMIRKVDAIIAISENTKRDLIEFFNLDEKIIHVIYLGANEIFRKIDNKEEIKRFKQKHDINYPFLLFVGTLEPRKNIENIIRALDLLKKDKFTGKLIIIGKKGWKYESIFNIIKLLRIENDVKILSNISDAELVFFYNCTELLMYPSLYEGFGLPILEAMSCGCPVLTSGISSMPEVGGLAAVYIKNPTNSKEIAEKAMEIIKDDKLRENMISEGFIQAKKFSWKKCAEETVAVYNSLSNN
ncbi:MAG: glycosyltransferase family 1 protein [Flavobacterium sp.]|nr:glycosyltransferase family 1 protein [Flavobacterium sp.]